MNDRKPDECNPLGSRDGAGSATVLAISVLIDFLNAYAHAGTDDGKGLRALVANGPPELRDWVTWLIVQNRSNPGQLTGTVSISGIHFQDFSAIQGTIPAATVSKRCVSSSSRETRASIT